MRRAFFFFVAGPIAVAAACIPRVAAAQGPEWPSYWDERVRAPREALEVTAGSAFDTGFGQIKDAAGNNVNDVATAGGAFDLGVGDRLSPRLGLGIRLHYAEYAGRAGDGGWSTAVGLDGTYHVAPFAHVDPWAQLGAGYRFFWDERRAPYANVFTHGFELGRVAVGFDFRVSPGFALGPILGADFDVFLWSTPSNTWLGDPHTARFAAFVFTGVQVRFDLRGSFEDPPVATRVAKRR